MQTYRMIVRRAPLYPLNSLMICSVVYAARGTAQRMNDDVGDLADEVRMACGGGTQCLELYLTPGRMQAAGWDALAEAIRWMRANREVLADSHWVGGDPGAGDVYGYASWSPRKGVLVLRNPRDQSATLELRLRDALQLPPGAPDAFTLQSPWQSDSGEPPLDLAAGDSQTFTLGPLQTRIFEIRPRP
jgi:hypothetical protein